MVRSDRQVTTTLQTTVSQKVFFYSLSVNTSFQLSALILTTKRFSPKTTYLSVAFSYPLLQGDPYLPVWFSLCNKAVWPSSFNSDHRKSQSCLLFLNQTTISYSKSSISSRLQYFVCKLLSFKACVQHSQQFEKAQYTSAKCEQVINSACLTSASK